MGVLVALKREFTKEITQQVLLLAHADNNSNFKLGIINFIFDSRVFSNSVSSVIHLRLFAMRIEGS